MLLFDHQLAFERGDLLGLTADLAVSLVVAAGLGGLVRISGWGRWAAVVLLGLWCLMNFANYEHVRELGSMVALAHAGYIVDPTFLRGSALAPARPLILLIVTVGSCVSLWWWSKAQRPFPVRRPLLAALLLIALFLIWPANHRLAAWRQSNFVLAQTSRLVTRATASPPSQNVLDRAVEADLDGELFIEALPRGSNVLLVILEGVSGAYLPSLRARHGADSTIDMPELDHLGKRELAWSTFVAHQRQTNRGEYALLCGDYPKLITSEPKMTELAGSQELDCLPSILAEAGFSTTYLQAAPMAFMVKNQFMPQAGFERSAGDTWFEQHYHRNFWGIDDRAFFEQSVGMIEDLQRGDRPWFLTLLTVGTHHPFNTPPDFEGSYAQGSAGWAMEYLDLAVGAFVRRIEELGILNDTLVVITSDESREMVPGDSDIANSFRQAWGLMIMLHPTGSSGVIDEPAMQLDLPISILDALGLGGHSGDLGGRSVFRRYREPRQLLWGNTYLGLVAGLSADRQLAVCSEDLRHCVATDLGGSLFSPDLQLLPVDPSEVRWLIHGAERSLATHAPNRATRELLLTAPGPMPVAADVVEQFVFGGQFLTIPAGTRADVDIEVGLTGGLGELRFYHDLTIGQRPEYLRSGLLKVGETLRIRYSVTAESALNDIESRFLIHEINGQGLALDFTTARIRLTPMTGEPDDSGIVEHLFVVE